MTAIKRCKHSRVLQSLGLPVTIFKRITLTLTLTALYFPFHKSYNNKKPSKNPLLNSTPPQQDPSPQNKTMPLFSGKEAFVMLGLSPIQPSLHHHSQNCTICTLPLTMHPGLISELPSTASEATSNVGKLPAPPCQIPQANSPARSAPSHTHQPLQPHRWQRMPARVARHQLRVSGVQPHSVRRRRRGDYGARRRVCVQEVEVAVEEVGDFRGD